MGYNRGNYIDYVRSVQALKDKERDLRIQQLELQVERRLLDQDQKITGVRNELLEEIRTVKDQFASLREFVVDGFQKMNEKFSKEILLINQTIADMRHEFGKEILRLDANQRQALTALQRYANEVQAYKAQSDLLAREAKNMRKESELILKRADNHFKKVELKEQKLRQNLEKFEGKMKLDLQKQKLVLDTIVNDQHNALKDIAYERMGVEVLNREISARMESQRKDINLQKKEIQGIEKNIERQKSLMKFSMSSYNKEQDLKDRLFFAKEKLMHQQNKMELMNRQHSISMAIASDRR